MNAIASNGTIHANAAASRLQHEKHTENTQRCSRPSSHCRPDSQAKTHPTRMLEKRGSVCTITYKQVSPDNTAKKTSDHWKTIATWQIEASQGYVK